MPHAWLDQLADGGLLLTGLKIGTGAGNVVLLRRDGDRVEERFTQRWAAFIPIRHEHEQLPESTAPAWERCDRPGWERLGVTADKGGVRVWVDGQDGPSWQLPSVGSPSR